MAVSPAEHASLMQLAYQSRAALLALSTKIAQTCVGADDYAACSAVGVALRQYVDGIGAQQLARAEAGDLDGLVRFLSTSNKLLAAVGDEGARIELDRARNLNAALESGLTALGVTVGAGALVAGALVVAWLLLRR